MLPRRLPTVPLLLAVSLGVSVPRAANAQAAAPQDTQASVATDALDPWTRRALNTDNTKVVGGWKAKMQYWPGFAALRFKTADGVGYFCGGAMIDPQWLLTAAHCLNSWDCADEETCKPSADLTGLKSFTDKKLTGKAAVEVVVGVEDLRNVPAAAVHQVELGRRHRKYVKAANEKVPRGGFDIALVKLVKPMEKGTFARLSTAAADPPEEARYPVMVAGFGRTEEKSDLVEYRAGTGAVLAPSLELRETLLPTMPRRECQSNIAKINDKLVIHQNELCALDQVSDARRDACQGDSGGPIVAFDRFNRPYVIGVTSWGIGCAEPDSPGVYTRVSSHATWMEAAGAKPSFIKAEERTSNSTRDAVAKAVEKVKRADDVDVMICASGADLACDNATPQLPRKDRFLALRVESQMTGKLLVALVTPDGRVEQLVPRTGASGQTILVQARKKAVIPEPGGEWQTGFPYDWDIYDGRLIVAVLPSNARSDAGRLALERIATEIGAAAQQTDTRSAGRAADPVRYLSALQDAIASGEVASAVLPLRK